MSLQGFESLLNPCAQMDASLNPLIYPEVGSSLEYEYSVTRGAAKAAWYSPCVRWILGGEIAMIVGGKRR